MRNTLITSLAKRMAPDFSEELNNEFNDKNALKIIQMSILQDGNSLINQFDLDQVPEIMNLEVKQRYGKVKLGNSLYNKFIDFGIIPNAETISTQTSFMSMFIQIVMDALDPDDAESTSKSKLIDIIVDRYKNKFNENDISQLNKFISESAFASPSVEEIIKIRSNSMIPDFFDINNAYVKVLLRHYQNSDYDFAKIARQINYLIPNILRIGNAGLTTNANIE